ncbi:MAG: hypothetical protein HKN98_10245 [Silicimonas sp.]|nr:hypothetical protein [Silicimonas sp.]RZW06940.1 MAG: hypothetical protein EX266_06950 [Paracoccaceae bacterium]
MQSDKPTAGTAPHDAKRADFDTTETSPNRTVGYLAAGAVALFVILGLWYAFDADSGDEGIPVETTNSIDATDGDVDQEPGAAINDTTGN